MNPVLGYAAFRIAASSANAANTQNIDCQGAITSTLSSPGRGLQFDVCQYCSIKLASNTTVDYGFILGTVIAGGGCSGSYQSSATLDYDGNGNEPSLTTCLDPKTVPLVRTPVKQFLASANTINTQSNPPPDLASNVSYPGNVVFRVQTMSNVSINPASPLWIVVRTGTLTAAITDQWDTAANFVTKLNGLAGIGLTFAASGQVYHARVCNETTVTETLVPNTSTGSGDSGTSVSIPAGGCGTFALTLTSVGTSSTLGIIGQVD